VVIRSPGSLGRLAAAALAALLGCAPPAPQTRVPSHTTVEGLALSEFAGATLARRISADQLVVVPKRIGIFQVSALSELVLTRARVELFETGGGTPRARATAMDAIVPAEGFAVPGLASVRHLAGATIYGLEVVIRRGGAPAARVEAAHARADVRTGNLVLRDFRLIELPAGRTVSAARATWRRGSDDFVIPGDWVATEAGRTRTGRGLRVDARFTAAPL
jgi:hypothetical protein